MIVVRRLHIKLKHELYELTTIGMLLVRFCVHCFLLLVYLWTIDCVRCL